QDVKEAMTGGSVAVVGKNAILRENIVEKQVTHDKTDFISTGKNLFNKEKVTLDVTLTTTTGQLTPSVGFAVSDFISVKENQTYTKTSATRVAFYDVNYQYIDSIASASFTTPVGTKFVRFAFGY